jgi:hypothetical protein
MAEGEGFVPKIAIFWANITQFVEQFKYTPPQYCLTRLYNLLTLLLTVPAALTREARVGIGRLKRRFQTNNTMFFRLLKPYSATTLASTSTTPLLTFLLTVKQHSFTFLLPDFPTFLV